MKRSGALETHDLSNDRLVEEILEAIMQPDGLFTFSHQVLGRERLNEKKHKPLAIAYVKALKVPDSTVSIGDPRGSGKSTLLVEDFIPWMPLQPPVKGTVFRGLDSRVALMAPRVGLASIRVGAVKRVFEHPVYRRLAGDFVKPDPSMWSPMNGLRIQRKGLGGEPTVMPLGLDSTSTMLHPPLVIVDDPVHENNWQSTIELARAKLCVVLAYNLTHAEAGVRVVIGNIWVKDDVQDSIRKSDPMWANAFIWRRGLLCCEECLNGRPDPDAEDKEKRHSHSLGELADPIIIHLDKPDGSGEPSEADAAEMYRALPVEISSAQLDNDPIPPGSTQLDVKDLRYWEWARGGDGEALPAISIGAAVHEIGRPGVVGPRVVSQGVREIIPLHDTDVYMFIDPASTEEEREGRSRFAAATVAVHRTTPRVFVLSEYAANKPPHVNYDNVLDMWLGWHNITNVKKVFYESVGYQATIGDTLVTQAGTRGIPIRIGDMEPLPRLKAEGPQLDRIRYALMPLMTNGCLYIHPSHRIFIQEVKTFGLKNRPHDLLDAVSNIVRIKKFKPRGQRRPNNDLRRLEKAGWSGYGA